MKVIGLRSCCLVLLLSWSMQSLVDIAREEAERRKRLKEQGIEGKVIEGNAIHLSPHGNITTSTGPTAAAPREPSAKSGSDKSQTSVRSYRTALQKLDREIQQTEARLTSRRSRLQSERWAPPKSGRSSTRSSGKNSQSQLQAEIEDLQIKLKQLREERFQIYEAGKKAGFLPGELEGKGLIP